MTATTLTAARPEDGPATSDLVLRLRGLCSMVAWLYLTVLGCLVLWIVVTVVAFGWQPTLTTGDSMAPSLRPGDVVLTSPIGATPLGTGSVIVFAGGQGNIIHRVTAVESDGTYRTRGDANRDEDARSVQPDRIVGAGRLLVPMIGLPVHWFRDGNAVAFTAWLTLTVGCLVLAPNPNRRRRRR